MSFPYPYLLEFHESGIWIGIWNPGSDNPMRIVLASASPRRRELLGTLGSPFDVRPSGTDESVEVRETPAQTIEQIALQKAMAVAALDRCNTSQTSLPFAAGIV